MCILPAQGLSVCDCHACTHVGCCFLMIVKHVEELISNSHAIVSSHPSPGLALTSAAFLKTHFKHWYS